MPKKFRLIVRVSLWMQIFQILFAILSGIGAISSLQLIIEGQTGFLVIFLVLVLMSYVSLANALSIIELTDDDISVVVFYGRFRILWEEINRIAMRGPYIARIGSGKRLVLSLAFANSTREALLDIVQEYAAKKYIKIEENASFEITHKNTRIWP